MLFPKDILVVDLEATGLNWNIHEIIQIGVLLLDKKTLKEKTGKLITIKPLRWNKRDPEAMKKNNISYESLKNGISLKQALIQLAELAKKPVILAQYGDFDSRWLRIKYMENKLPYPFDYHTLDIWSLTCAYLAKRNKLTHRKFHTGFSMETALTYFKIPITQARHNALADARYEAKLLKACLE